MTKTATLLKVLKSYGVSARRFRWAFLGVFITYGLASFVSGVITPLVYRRIIDTISSGVTDHAALAGDLFQSFWVLVFVIITYQILYRSGDFCIAFAESKTMESLNNRVFGVLMRQGYTFFTERFSGSLVAQGRRYVRVFEDITDGLVFNFWMPFVRLSGIIGTLFLIQPTLAGIFLVWIPFYILFAVWMTKKKFPYDTASSEQDSAITAQLSDSIANIFAVKTFASEYRESSAFEQVARQDEQARRRSWYFNNRLIAVLTILFSVLEITAMYTVIRLWLEGSVTTGTVVLVQIYVGAIFGELFGFGRSLGRLMKHAADASEMLEIMERTDGEVLDEKDASIVHAGSVQGAVTFEQITFRYPKGGEVFEDFSLSIKAGEKVGLVGASGSGKSTLTKLLLKFVVPERGVIRVAGKDISTMFPQELRRLIAYVPQDTALFHRSIAENIAYGRPESSQEMIEEAAKKAHAHEFIMSMPKGYDTLVGERGVKLSGGERQRVAIARAILKDAPILVLDEATSALDTTSEHLIQEALHELMQGRTTLVIAHRLSTVREMDRIIVLENGAFAEEGTHAELIEQSGIYAGFWNRQTSSFGGVLIDEGEE